MNLLHVFLSDVRVGVLGRGRNNVVSFRLLDSYKSMHKRPTLGQQFEDDLDRIYKGKAGELPNFFANLVPEGLLRDLIESSLPVRPETDLDLLSALGGDLPGAIILRAENGPDNGLEAGEADLDLDIDEVGGMRFSLAGVQLKFSVIRSGERLTLPAHGELGDYIVKLQSSRFPLVVENEFAMLQWASAAGFDVPERSVVDARELGIDFQRFGVPSTGLLVRRFDRTAQGRIHQEDLAQALGVAPRNKYGQVTHEQIAKVVLSLMGEEGLQEYIRRLVFVIASGNGDAHLKNWALLYLDPSNPRLSPLYDQVSTIAWPELDRELAIKLCGSRLFSRIDISVFERLASRLCVPADRMMDQVQSTVATIARSWQDAGIDSLLPDRHAEALRAHWRHVPLLKALASEL